MLSSASERLAVNREASDLIYTEARTELSEIRHGNGVLGAYATIIRRIEDRTVIQCEYQTAGGLEECSLLGY